MNDAKRRQLPSLTLDPQERSPRSGIESRYPGSPRFGPEESRAAAKKCQPSSILDLMETDSRAVGKSISSSAHDPEAEAIST